MIIVSDKNTIKTTYFPRNLYSYEDSMYTLVLDDRASNKKYKFDVEDTLEATYGFYSFVVDFSGLPVGEYEYSIFGNGDKTIPDTDYEITYGKFFDTFKVVMKNKKGPTLYSKGLIRLNELKLDNVNYNKNNEFITYDKF